MNATVLVVDDDAALRRALSDRLRSWGHLVVAAESGEEALAATREREFDLVLLDLSMPGLSGVDVLRRLREEDYPADIVVLTAYGSLESAVEAIKIGAANYLPKPADFEIIRKQVDHSIERRRMRSWRRAIEEQSNERAFTLGRSPRMRELADRALLAAQSNTTVLVTGESGSGKQVLAEFIHRESPRREAPFLHVNCVAITDSLIESTLFGHEKGAFTDATVRKEGRLEAAAGGTVFLDEIGDVSPMFQAKLLHFLDKGEFERVGGTRTLTVDCRIVAATNRDLPEAIRDGRFREDLYHRLNVVRLHIPPLRERREDIPMLAETLLDQVCNRLKRPRIDLAPETLDALVPYAWPGNVRQLENALERMVVFARSQRLTPDLLPPEIQGGNVPARDVGADGRTLKEATQAFRRDYIAATLAQAGGRKADAARMLGIQRTFLSRLIKELGL